MSLFSYPLPLATPVDVFAGALGGTAALLIIGGTLFLRAQRNRQQFLLMQAALEKGITSFPGQPPFWLLSLRTGITTITLGIALIIVGAGAWKIGQSVERPTDLIAKEPAPPREEPPQDTHQPQDRPMPGMDPDAPPAPPRPERRPPPRNPIIEQWLKAQMEETLGQIAVGCGIILLLLGLTRTGFARTERRFANTPGATP